MFNDSQTLPDLAQVVLQHCLKQDQEKYDQPIIKIADQSTTAHVRALARPQKDPIPLEEVLDSARDIFKNHVNIGHSRFFGMIPSPASKLSWLGDMLSTSYNSNAACWYLGSGVSAVESSLISWAAEQVGLPTTAGGCFVSGGSMANLTALAAARDKILAFPERSQAVVYCSEQTHCSNAKALRILGFGDHQLHKIATDNNNRIRPEVLQAAIWKHRSQGRVPFCIMATCGTTNTGSIDPLAKLSAISRAEKMWLHVDGAYGASVALSKNHKQLVQDLRCCDSLSWDFQKWTFQTYGCALVLVRDKSDLRQCLATGGDYLQDAGPDAVEYPNFWNYGAEMSRPARGMRLWFSLQMMGLDQVGDMIDHGFVLSNTAEQALKQYRHWEIVSHAQMGIVCFRYAPPYRTSAQLDNMNKQISKAAIESNLCAPLTTQLGGNTVLRICSIHPDLPTSEMEDIIRGLDSIAQRAVLEYPVDETLFSDSPFQRPRSDSNRLSTTRIVSSFTSSTDKGIASCIAVRGLALAI